MDAGTEMEQQQAQYDQQQQGPRTARGGGGPTSRSSSVNTAAMEGGMAATPISSRLLPKPAEIQAFHDVMPALRRWLQDQDAIFKLAEQKTGLDREKVGFVAF